ADGAARIGANEIDDVFDRSDAAEAFGGFVHPVAQRAVRSEQELIGVAQALDVLAGKAAPLHADNVEPAKPRPLAPYLSVRDDVAPDARQPPDHGIPSDPDKLMDGAKPAEDGVVFNDNMTRKSGVVGHHHMVCDLTVMSNMRADHEQAVVADPRHHPASSR